MDRDRVAIKTQGFDLAVGYGDVLDLGDGLDLALPCASPGGGTVKHERKGCLHLAFALAQVV